MPSQRTIHLRFIHADFDPTKAARKATSPRRVESKTLHVEVSLFLLFAASASRIQKKAQLAAAMFLIIFWFVSFSPRGTRAEN